MSRQPIAIFGGPGSGAIAAQSLAAGDQFALSGYLNDALPVGTLVSGAPVLGSFSSWRELPGNVLLVAPLHNASQMPARARRIAELGVPIDRWATIIDPRSAIAADAVIGPGCFIGPFATVGPVARIGAHGVVRAGAHVSHDCVVGNFTFVGTNAVVCGSGVLDDGAYVAPNATVRDRCRVGRFALVGLGAVVVKDVPDFAIVAGAPARRIGTVEA